MSTRSEPRANSFAATAFTALATAAWYAIVWALPRSRYRQATFTARASFAGTIRQCSMHISKCPGTVRWQPTAAQVRSGREARSKRGGSVMARLRTGPTCHRCG